jgi:myosin heavy subunit
MLTHAKERLLGSLDVSPALYQLGRTKVFFKGGVSALFFYKKANPSSY